MSLLLATMHPNTSSQPNLYVSVMLDHLRQMDHKSQLFLAMAISSLFALLVYLGSQRLPCKDSDGFPFLHGLPFIGSWDFFTRRHFFAHEGLVKLGDVFSFNVLQVRLPYLFMAHLPLM